MNEYLHKFMLNETAASFFLSSYFGIWPEELQGEKKNDIALKCAHRAYLDLNRTLRFNDTANSTDSEVNTELKEIRKRFCCDMCEKIVGLIFNQLLNTTVENFDTCHEQVCNIITELARTYPANSKEALLAKISRNHGAVYNFYDGQAQKWLNMTVKYMWMLGLWPKLQELLPKLHVPVDSFILEAVWHEGLPENDQGHVQPEQARWRIPLPNRDQNNDPKRCLMFDPAKVIAWSQWEYKEYERFQEALRGHPMLGGKMPLEWEASAWIEIAKKRSAQ